MKASLRLAASASRRFVQTILLLLLASPRIAAAQEFRPFAPGRFDHMLANSQVRIAASGGYGGNSIDLLAISSAGRILNDFVASDVLLIGGLIPGDGGVRFGSHAAAGVFATLPAGPSWEFSAAVEGGSYMTVRLPKTAADLLRLGNVVTSDVDTRNMFARVLATREIGIGVAHRIHTLTSTLTVAANARHLAPLMFAAARIDPLRESPALTVDGERVSAQADVVYAGGHPDGSGYALDFFARVEFQSFQASVHLADVGKVRIRTQTHHRAVDVDAENLEAFAEHIDATTETIASQTRSYGLPRRIDVRGSALVTQELSAGVFLRHQDAGDLGISESAVGSSLGWAPVQPLGLRAGIALIDGQRWNVLAGAGLELGPVLFDLSFDADDFPTFDRARGVQIGTSLGFRF